jgi:hypothetical protein
MEGRKYRLDYIERYEKNSSDQPDYAVENKISGVSYCVVVPCVECCNRIIAIGSKYCKDHKFGIKVLKSCPSAKVLDKEKGEDSWWGKYWQEIIGNVRPAFEVWEKDPSELSSRM